MSELPDGREYPPFRVVPAVLGAIAGVAAGVVFHSAAIGFGYFLAVGLAARCGMAFLTPQRDFEKMGLRVADVGECLMLIFALDVIYLGVTWYFNSSITANQRLDQSLHGLAWLLGLLTVAGVARRSMMKRRP